LANAFDQNLGTWDVGKVKTMSSIFASTSLSRENYDATLIGWAALPALQSNVWLGAHGTSYCEGTAARQSLIDEHGWNIVGDTFACDPDHYAVTVEDETPWGGQ